MIQAQSPAKNSAGYVDWQSTKSKLSDRGAHLLETGLWSDCQFVVGNTPNVQVSNIFDRSIAKVVCKCHAQVTLFTYIRNPLS